MLRPGSHRGARFPRQSWRILFSFITGAFLGVGVAALPSIGLYLLLAGVVLGIVGAFWVRGQDTWALLVGFGAVPSLLITWALLTLPPACAPTESFMPMYTHHGMGGMGSAYSCSGPVPAAYYALLITFVVIALVGLAWPLIQNARTRYSA